MSATAALMDRIYSWQRHIYDATRKFYLLGRDGLIEDLKPPPRGRVLEIGCGTARNLIRVARRYPDAACYGIDISEVMLATADRSVRRAGVRDRVRLAAGDAASFEAQAQFGVPHFDRVLISYALSMIPAWQNVLRHAAGFVAPGGSLHVVDFGDQSRLPKGFKRLFFAWLAWFHVMPRVSLRGEIDRLAHEQGMRASTRSLFRGYAICCDLER